MTETAAALPPLSSASAARIQNIRPLGDQIIIRLIQPESVGSIIVPDSAKRITHQGEDDGPGSGSEELQYVNRWLFEDITESLKRILTGMPLTDADKEALKDLVFRANRALLPKNATGIIPQNGAGLNFVEAEVVAVGPGRRAKSPDLIEALAHALQFHIEPPRGRTDLHDAEEFFLRLFQKHQELIRRARQDELIPLSVKVGNRVWYHPSVQRFDRQIDLGDGETYFIIGEHSVLAVLGEDE